MEICESNEIHSCGCGCRCKGTSQRQVKNKGFQDINNSKFNTNFRRDEKYTKDNLRHNCLTSSHRTCLISSTFSAITRIHIKLILIYFLIFLFHWRPCSALPVPTSSNSSSSNLVVPAQVNATATVPEIREVIMSISTNFSKDEDENIPLFELQTVSVMDEVDKPKEISRRAANGKQRRRKGKKGTKKRKKGSRNKNGRRGRKGKRRNKQKRRKGKKGKKTKNPLTPPVNELPPTVKTDQSRLKKTERLYNKIGRAYHLAVNTEGKVVGEHAVRAKQTNYSIMRIQSVAQRGVVTIYATEMKMYICVTDRGIVFSSTAYMEDQCRFKEHFLENNVNAFESQTCVECFLGMTKSGKIKKAHKVRKNLEEAHFLPRR